MRDQDDPSPTRTWKHELQHPTPILLRRRFARQKHVHSRARSQRQDRLRERDLPADPNEFLHAIKPFRKNLVVGCECMFAWYWLADLCEDQKIPFVLGHALAMKHIHGGKAKNDRIDAGKLAAMLRGGLFPLAYAYPRGKRQTRDLLRRRSFFVRQRAQLIAHIVNTNSQFNLPPLPKKLATPRTARRRSPRPSPTRARG